MLFYTVPTPTTTTLRPARALKPSQQPQSSQAIHFQRPSINVTHSTQVARALSVVAASTNNARGARQEGRHMRTCRQTRAPESHLHGSTAVGASVVKALHARAHPAPQCSPRPRA